MIYVLFNKGLPVHVTNETPYTGTPKLKEFPGVEYDEVKGSWEFVSLDEVEQLAAFATTQTGQKHLGYDHGESVSPRFGLIVAPVIGAEVSRAFNGDYYSAGKIVKITKGWRITTSDGTVFNRKRSSPCWKAVGGTWTMVAGSIDRLSLEF